MNLRWNNYEYKTTLEDVQAYRRKHGCGLIEAKNALTQPRRVLEYFDDDDQEWKEVPETFTTLDPL